MKLLDLYKSLLKTANLVVTEDGYVSRSFGGKTEPAMIKGKRLVLPTKEHLANPDWKERIVFHPLSENILRGESAVLEEYRTSLNVRFNYTIGLLAYQLLVIATSEDEHKKLSPDQSEYLSRVKNADEKTLEALKKLMKAMATNQSQRAFVSIYLKRGGTVGGRRHARVGVVTFPLYQELAKPDVHEVWGVKLRVKDREALQKLLEYMVPGIDQAESHNRGSDSEVAPYLDALMKAALSVASPLNDIIELFRNHLADGEDDPAGPDQLLFEDAWVETFENLSVMVPEIRAIPMQAGNEGTPVKQAPAATAAAGVPATPTPAPASPLPAALSAPQSSWGHPQPSAFAAPPAPAVVHTAGGLDFDSVLRTNPVLGGQFGNTGGGWSGAQQQQQQSVPRWAQGGGGGWSQPSGQQSGWGGGSQWSGGGGGGWGNRYNPSV